jgi:hypothetical protein
MEVSRNTPLAPVDQATSVAELTGMIAARGAIRKRRLVNGCGGVEFPRFEVKPY